MTVLGVIGDIHANPRLERVLVRLRRAREDGALDGVLLVGDLGYPDVRPGRPPDPPKHARYLASVAKVLDDVRALGVPVAWVPGNHDLPDVPGEGNADGRVLEVAGLRVHGIGGAGPERFGFAYEWDEDEIRRRAELECEVLLVHTPPARTRLDVVLRGEHVGSEAVRERAERHRGVLVCGHIHEAPGADLLGACLCLNAGALGEPYGRTQVAFVRWDDSGAADHEVVHEDLGSGRVRRWRRADLAAGGGG